MTESAKVVGPRTLHDILTAAGDVPSAWADELRAVPREHVVPARVWVEVDGEYTPIDRAEQFDLWRELVYSDRVIVTQFDDGATGWPAVGVRPSCSASMPSAVFGMLAALDVHPGQRALDIGTGTGYNAGLLACRLGDDAVTTIEIDAALTAGARASLATAGHRPSVIHGDGAAGYADRAPYDRIIATAAVQLGRLPQA